MRRQIGEKQVVIDGKPHVVRIFSPRRPRGAQKVRVKERMGAWQMFANHPVVRVVSQPMAPKS